MTMAETSAAGGYELSKEQLAQLFELYESTVRVVINQELNWEQLLDEKTILWAVYATGLSKRSSP
jgi:hypothetical protein